MTGTKNNHEKSLRTKISKILFKNKKKSWENKNIF